MPKRRFDRINKNFKMKTDAVDHLVTLAKTWKTSQNQVLEFLLLDTRDWYKNTDIVKAVRQAIKELNQG